MDAPEVVLGLTDQLDSLVENVFPLLNSLGVTDIKGLGALVNDNLYTNENLTKLATTLYGALDGNDTVANVFDAIGIDVSTKGIAHYLTDKSYGRTYSTAAATLKKTKSWKKVKSLNWGFSNGSSKAKEGFVNGLAAVLRPLNDVLSIFLAAILTNNYILSKFLGICPFLGVSKKLDTAVSKGQRIRLQAYLHYQERRC